MNEELSFVKGKILKKILNSSENTKAPSGFIYLENDNRKFTIWKKNELDKIVVGGEYDIGFLESENVWCDNKYINYNTKTIQDITVAINPKKISFEEKEISELEKENQDTSKLKIGDGSIGFCIMNHEVVIGDVKKIVVPKDAYYYLMEKYIENEKSD